MFANEDNSLLVISIKGADVGLWSGGPTAEKDKSNVTNDWDLSDAILNLVYFYRQIYCFRAAVQE